ncbi:CARDB domain-containing protein [Haloplanus sp. GCM10025708]|uniref:COG1361 S-layer family protein n=1 Tax=Haloplanus sp. GCM10025708 TaxID=3252679 RepID=UPI00361A537D
MTPAVPVLADDSVYGEPDLSLSVADDTFRASETATLSIDVTNDGQIYQGGPAKYEQQVQTARNVQMKILEDRIDAPIDVKTGTVAIGSIPEASTAPFEFALELGQVQPGTYRIPVEVSYKHVRAVTYSDTEQPEYVWLENDERKYVTIRVEDRPQFEVVSEGSNSLFAGDTGTLSFSLKNTGTREARAASVRLSSKAPEVFFGNPSNQQRTTSLYVPSLAPGETTNLSVQVGATGDVSPGEYPIETVVAYQNQNDVTERSDALTTGVTVRPERTFAIDDLRTQNFRVGESEARITGDVVNAGEGVARNVVVRLRTNGPMTPTNGESAVGDLEPGESKRVSFTTAISEDAQPGTNSFAFTVEYENAEGDVRTAGNPVRKSISIGEERDPFRVVGVNTSVTPGGTADLRVRLQYLGDDPVSATNAKLFVSDPLSSSDDGAYLGTVEPNETTTATFRVSAASGALVKSYAASVEVRYDEPDGDTKFTDGLSLGVPVSESESGPPVLPIAVVVGLVVLGAGAYLYRRR